MAAAEGRVHGSVQWPAGGVQDGKIFCTSSILHIGLLHIFESSVH